MFFPWLRRKAAVSRKASGKPRRLTSRRLTSRRSRLESLEARRVLAPLINEIHFNPLFGDANQDQYVEIRGDAGQTLANGTYLVGVSGNNFVNTPGQIHTVFNLSGLQLGSNGFLVLTQQGGNYAIDPAANTATGSDGFIGLKAAGDPLGTNRFSTSVVDGKAIQAGTFDSNTYFLIQSPAAPAAGGDVDANNDGVVDGAALGWTILDGVSVLDGGDTEFAYADIVFAADGDGNTPPGAEVVSTKSLFPISWVGRNDDSTGSTAADWVGGQTQERGGDSFIFKLNNNSVYPPVFAGRNLDHLGAPNFFASVHGVVFDDADGNGVQDGGEGGMAGVQVYLDVNNNGVPDDYVTVIEPDAFPDDTIVQNRTPGVTLTVMDPFTGYDQTPEETIPVTSHDEANWASTGQRVFAHAGVPFFADIRQLRMDFYKPAKAISIDVTAFVSTTVGRLSVFDAQGNELEFVLSGLLEDRETATLTLVRPQADIAYAVAYSQPGDELSDFGRFDNLRFTLPEPRTTSGVDGSYEISGVAAQSSQLPGFNGEYRVRQIRPTGALQTFPAGNGSHLVTADDTADIVNIDFGNKINQPPSIPGGQVFEVVENAGPGDVIGLIVADDDADQELVFQIVGGTGQGLFAIDPATGLLMVGIGGGLDYEAADSYTLEIEVTDDAPEPASSTTTITINLTDEDDVPLGVQLDDSNVDEGESNGVFVGNLAAIYLGGGVSAPPVFELVAGPGDTHNHLFQISGNVLSVAPGVSLDYESDPLLSIRVRIFNGLHEAESVLLINVNDINEPPTDIEFSSIDFPEDADNSVAAVFVGALFAEDPEGHLVNFALVGSENDNDLFEIVGNQLFFRQGVPLDYEIRSTYTIKVEATDGAGSIQKVLTVHVTNVNEVAPAVLLSPATIAESAGGAGDVLVGMLTAEDPDSSSPSYSFEIVGGSEADLFVIDADQLLVKAGVELDHETRPQLNVVVRGNDPGGSFVDTELTIAVGDVNEGPHIADQLFEIAENSPLAALVGTIAAADDDTGQTLSFTVLGGSGDGVFNVDSLSGQITVANPAALDYESTQSFDLLIEVTDDGDPALSAQATITIQLTDVDDHPGGVELSGDGSVDEGESNGVFVGQLSASNPSGDGASEFELVSGEGDTHNSLFQIDGDVLSLVQGVVIDYETTPILFLRVSVFNGFHTAESPLTVNVNDLNEAPTGIELSNNIVVDTVDTESGPALVGDLTVLDPDGPGGYTFSLESDAGGEDNGFFQITGATLEFQQGVTLDHTVKGSYSVLVRAQNGDDSVVQAFTIMVLGPNEAPFAQPDQAMTQMTQSVTVTVLANDGDADGILDPLSVTIVSPPANGMAQVNADGTITYMPDAGFEGQDTLQYTVADDRGEISNAALVTIDVTNGPVWQNPLEHLDVDGDGEIDILDLLALVSFLRQNPPSHPLTNPPGQGDPMVDVDGNGMAELRDLLLLVAHLREQAGNAEPEGESNAPLAAPAPESSFLFALDEDDDPWSGVLNEVAEDVART